MFRYSENVPQFVFDAPRAHLARLAQVNHARHRAGRYRRMRRSRASTAANTAHLHLPGQLGFGATPVFPVEHRHPGVPLMAKDGACYRHGTELSWPDGTYKPVLRS